jgi:hypothetical protein
MDDNQIKFMAGRFLGWKLPEDFNPDGGIEFHPLANGGTPLQRMREPSGTNLFNAAQAEAMVRHIIDGLPTGSSAKSSNNVTTRQTGYQQAVEAVAKEVKTDMNAAREGARTRGAKHVTKAEAAKSIASMVAEWVEGGIRGGTDWRNGLEAVISKRLERLTAAPASSAEPVNVKFGDMPSYGQATGKDLLAAVHEAIYGTGHVKFSEIDDDRPLGHQMVPRINFNSLNRIVTAFVNGSKPG